MTNEQREAVKMVEDIKNNAWTTKYIMSSDSKKADTVLSLIKEQQVEIDGLKNKEVLIKRYFNKCDLIKQKDRQIDLMADFMYKTGTGRKALSCVFRQNDECNENGCEYCIKRYFADLIEKEDREDE